MTYSKTGTRKKQERRRRWCNRWLFDLPRHEQIEQRVEASRAAHQRLVKNAFRKGQATR